MKTLVLAACVALPALLQAVKADEVRFDAVLMRNCAVVNETSFVGKFDQPVQFVIDQTLRITATASKPGMLGKSSVEAQYALLRNGQWITEKPQKKMDAWLDKTPSFEALLSDPALRVVLMPRLPSRPKGIPRTKQKC